MGSDKTAVEVLGVRLEGFRPTVQIGPILKEHHEKLGALVRKVWVDWAKEQPEPKQSWLTPWEELSESEKEVDRRIGVRLAGYGAINFTHIFDSEADIIRIHAEAETLSEMQQDNIKLRTENARLREALTRIMRNSDDDCAADVARDALEGKGT